MALQLYSIVFKGRMPGPFVYAYAKSIPNYVRINAPLRGKTLVGMVVGKLSTSQAEKINFKLQAISNVLDEKPVLQKADYKFAEWMARYYFAFLGDAIALFVSFTAGVKKNNINENNKENEKEKHNTNNYKVSKLASKATLIATKKNSSTENNNAIKNKSSVLDRTLLKQEVFKQEVPLTAVQEKVLQQLSQVFFSKENDGYNRIALLEGVTGSGKSYVYAALAKKYLLEKKSVLLLVPEISIAVGALKLFSSFIPSNMLHVFHSKQTLKNKNKLKSAAENNNPVLVLGTRSTLFIPRFNSVGLVIVDEEHEDAYKNNYAPRYHVRQAAQYYCKQRKAALLLGSATPSVESQHFALKSKIAHVRLLQKHNPAPKPLVELLQVQRQKMGNENELNLLHSQTLSGIKSFVSSGRGVMVFVNRRGFSSILACKNCGHFPMCKSCDVALTYYKQKGILRCHYCNYVKKIHMQVAQQCGQCQKKAGYIFYKSGTEKITDFLKVKFPNLVTARFDSEAASTPKKINAIVNSFRSGETNILVGTQMLAKGHNFPLAGLMVIVRVESVLALPDFRASERLYRTIVQAVGRVGRSEARVAKVIMETSHATDATVIAALEGRQQHFYSQQLQFRQLFFYPPFSKLIKFVVRSKKEDKAKQIAQTLRDALLHAYEIAIKNGFAVVLNAVPCFFTKLQGSYRYMVLLKIQRNMEMLQLLQKIQKSTQGLFFAQPGSVVEIDVDPVDLF